MRTKFSGKFANNESKSYLRYLCKRKDPLRLLFKTVRPPRNYRRLARFQNHGPKKTKGLDAWKGPGLKTRRPPRNYRRLARFQTKKNRDRAKISGEVGKNRSTVANAKTLFVCKGPALHADGSDAPEAHVLAGHSKPETTSEAPRFVRGVERPPRNYRRLARLQKMRTHI